MVGRPDVSRREFLLFLGISAFAAIVSVWLMKSFPRRVLARIRSFVEQRTNPPLGRTPAAPLTAPALRVLEATTAILADTPVEMSHYSSYFRWRAENLRGYRDLYEEFARTLDAAAMRVAGKRFLDADAATKRRILQRIDLNRGPLRGFLAGVFDSRWIRFEKYVVREILALFVRTDGWVLLGYESWPGTPRGLDKYTRPPGRRLEAA